MFKGVWCYFPLNPKRWALVITHRANFYSVWILQLILISFRFDGVYNMNLVVILLWYSMWMTVTAVTVLCWQSTLLPVNEQVGWAPTLLTDVLHGSLQSLQVNAGIVPEIRIWSLLFISFSVHYSLIILLFDSI